MAFSSCCEPRPPAAAFSDEAEQVDAPAVTEAACREFDREPPPGGRSHVHWGARAMGTSRTVRVHRTGAFTLVAAATLLAVAGTPTPAPAGTIPTSQVVTLLPGSTQHYSVPGEIGPVTRDAIRARTGITLKAHQLGPAELVVADVADRPVGVIHVRHEAGPRSAVKITWALDPFGRIVDYAIDAPGDSTAASLTAPTIRRLIAGRDVAWLRAQLSPDGRVRPGSELRVADAAKPLLATVLRSAMTTIVLVDATWPETLAELRYEAHTFAAFPTGIRAEPFARPHDKVLESRIPERARLSPEHTRLVRIRNTEGDLVGCSVRTRVAFAGASRDIWWSVGRDGRMKRIVAEPAWSGPEMRAALAELVGASREDIAGPSPTAKSASPEALARYLARVVLEMAENATIFAPGGGGGG